MQDDETAVKRVAHLARRVYSALAEPLNDISMTVELLSDFVRIRNYGHHDRENVAVVPFPETPNCSADDRVAALMYEGCRASLGWTYHLLDVLLFSTNVAREVASGERDGLDVKNPIRPAIMEGFEVPRHTVLKCLMVRSNEFWVIDLSGAQYGHFTPALPLKAYQDQIGNNFASSSMANFGSCHEEGVAMSSDGHPDRQWAKVFWPLIEKVGVLVDTFNYEQMSLSCCLIEKDDMIWNKATDLYLIDVKNTIDGFLIEQHGKHADKPLYPDGGWSMYHTESLEDCGCPQRKG